MSKMIKVTNCVRGVLSPLLSNIILDELDKEMEKRQHSFVRYADDISLYVQSEVAGKRVMNSLTKLIEGKLLLKVNRGKTKVSRPEESMLLGFSFRTYKGRWIIKVARKSAHRIKRKLKVITKRNAPLSEEERITKLNTIIKGWVNYFVIAKAKTLMQHLDGNVRVRLRMCKWKQWKNISTRRLNLLKLGAKPKDAYLWGRSSKGYCRIAQTFILCKTLTAGYYQRKGYAGFYDLYYGRTEKQIKLF